MSLKVEQVLQATDDEIVAIKKWYGKTGEELENDVKMLRTWLAKQPHLPQNIEDIYFEKLLRMNKFSLERCKKKIDMFFSIKHLTPEIFEDRDLLDSKMQFHMDNVMLCPLPKLTADFSRIHIFKFITNNAENFDLTRHAKYLFAMADMRFIYDECITDTYICDMGNCTMGHVLKHNLVLLKKGATIIEQAYSDRIKGVHFINLPNCANILVNFANAIFNEKMAKRVHVHKDLESLHQMIPKQVLPKEYGGQDQSITILNNNWRKLLEANNTWLKEIGNSKSIEKLRNGKPLDSDIFGSIHGSFRQLTVD